MGLFTSEVVFCIYFIIVSFLIEVHVRDGCCPYQNRKQSHLHRGKSLVAEVCLLDKL